MLELRGLAKAYGDVVALADVDLTAAPGRLMGFLGPNGAGKTTTMRSVFGLVRLDAGTVQFKGRPIGQEERLRFGYMPEQRGLYPRMPILTQLVHFARLHGMAKDAAEAAARSWLERLGLGDRADDRLDQLSHGNQQRVQLAGALVHEPELLILDEPFSGLDPIGVDAMVQILRDEAAKGVAVVFSSHQLDLVESLCDDVTVIASGRVVLSGGLDDVRDETTHRRCEITFETPTTLTLLDGCAIERSDGRAYVLRVPKDLSAERLLVAAGRDGTVARFVHEPPTLSEIFREVVGA